MNKSQIVMLFIPLICFYSTTTAQKAVVNYDSLRIRLEKMYDADQGIRRILVDSIGFNSPETQKYLQKMMNIDHQNKIEIENILDKYRWLEKTKIGEKASESIFYAVQHTDLGFMEKYFPQFQNLANRGEASTMRCAMMQDRLLMWKGKKQVYGSQADNTLRSDKKIAIWPIENPSEVNRLRKTAGFTTTVEENAKQLKAEYDPNEKLPSKH